MNAPTIQDAINFCRADEHTTNKQYGDNLDRMCDVVALHRKHDLRKDAADVEVYRQWVPKFDKRSAPLLELISKADWRPGTYKQYAEDGRRAIEHFTGALRERQERKARRDDWYYLVQDLESLVATRLAPSGRFKSVRKLADICRSHRLDLAGLTGEALIDLHGCVPAKHWSHVVKGAEALDWLRSFDTLVPQLPERPLDNVSMELREKRPVPEGLSGDIAEWVRVATTNIPSSAETEDAKAVLAERHSDGAIGVFTAAMGAFISSVAGRHDITCLNTIDGLFSDENIETVLVEWIAAHRKGGNLHSRRARFTGMRIV
ncbi:hypothetical protein K3720_13720 [Leisingera caerulea]|uniref:hypothetical protein n=1 Tax=Leisingera caerulea TaxID=506591 RepID=UPI0021A7FBC0|nr:hypothetical protein [Leisingera caerulea]UWQ48972.1 hypothetical protein K3720_13720 [Leisingera caerulea]